MNDQDDVWTDDVLLISGGEVKELTFDSEGRPTVTTTLWGDYWPSGTVVINGRDEVIGLKLGKLWLDARGNLLRDLGPLMDAPHHMTMASSDTAAVCKAFTEMFQAQTKFRDRLIMGTDARLPSRGGG